MSIRGKIDIVDQLVGSVWEWHRMPIEARIPNVGFTDDSVSAPVRSFVIALGLPKIIH